MKMKRFLLWILLSAFLLPGLLPAAQSRENTRIALLTVHLLQTRHYIKLDCTEETSKKFFNAYLKMLDPQHLFFTKQQVREWSVYAPELIRKLSGSGDASFGYALYASYLRRLSEYEQFVQNQHFTEQELNASDTWTFDRTKSDWPEDEIQMKKLWKNKLRNDLILIRILNRIEQEEEAEERKKTDPAPVWKKISPEEQVCRRVKQFVRSARKQEQLEVLALYLNALAGLFDPHTLYMTPKQEEEFNMGMRLSLVGIGAVLTTSEDGYTKIVEIIPGGPAEQDGRLKAGDRIISVQQKGEDAVSVSDMPLSQVVSMIRGKEDTEVTLRVFDGTKGITSAPKTIRLIRREVQLKESEAKGEIREVKRPDGQTLRLGVITLPSFYLDFEACMRGDQDYKSSTQDVRKILQDFKKKHIQGVVIDLRSNGGGALQEAISLTGLFIRRGPVVQIRNAAGQIQVEEDEDNGEIVYDGPLVILTNCLSASASEIFAGAIRDSGRGIVAGDSKTHGKGTVQTVAELDKLFSYFKSDCRAGLLKFTNAKFYRINGESTQLRGIVPDIVFPSFAETMDVGEEKLENAMPWDTVKPARCRPPFDPALEKKIPVLKARSGERIRKSPEFALLRKDIERSRENRKKKTLLLNFEKRWKEYREEKKIHDEQSRLLRLDDQKKGKKNSAKDIYLDETLQILCDMISLQAGGNSLH